MGDLFGPNAKQTVPNIPTIDIDGVEHGEQEHFRDAEVRRLATLIRSVSRSLFPSDDESIRRRC